MSSGSTKSGLTTSQFVRVERGHMLVGLKTSYTLLSEGVLTGPDRSLGLLEISSPILKVMHQ
jgi:hypothetical protein